MCSWVVNVLIQTPGVCPGDAQLIFGGWNDPDPVNVIEFPASARWSDVLVAARIFASKGQARKAGFDEPIPFGYSEKVIGKIKQRFCVWKPTEEWDTARPRRRMIIRKKKLLQPPVVARKRRRCSN